MDSHKFPIVLLISGRGSNMEALIKRINEKHLPIKIAAVISDKASAPGLAIAHNHNIPTVIVPRQSQTKSNEEFNQLLIDAVKGFHPELIVLAGFMRVLAANFISTFKNKIINIHPSLLPSFPGLAAQEQALNAGVKVTGCTVHYVNNDVDAGPIIAQTAVPVLADDTVESLQKRILEQEHQLLPAVVEAIASGGIKLPSK